MLLSKYSYLPLLRTRSAELKGLYFLDEEVKDGILPIIELTRSRRSKNNQIGRISNNIDKVIEAIDDRPFILDLASEEVFMNSEIAGLLDYKDGYKKWCDFVAGLSLPNAIPVVHYSDEASDDDIIRQVKLLDEQCGAIAFRINIYDDYIDECLDIISKGLKDLKKLILILDAEFVSLSDIKVSSQMLANKVYALWDKYKDFTFVFVSSTFPRIVTEPGYGEDSHGIFSIGEIEIFNAINKKVKKVKYGDYGSIHPVKVDTPGVRWIPRIDFPTKSTFFYHRVRRGEDESSENAYITAAKRVLNDRSFVDFGKIGVWGMDEILNAAKSNPSGISPSHWIAVRFNLYITRQFIRLS